MTRHSGTYRAEAAAEGHARGEVLVLTATLSFWGGVDPVTGRIIDRRHPQAGSCVTGTVLLMPGSRGSSSSSSVLAEAIRCGTAPAAIVLNRADAILVIGAIVARRLYGKAVPIVVVDPGTSRELHDGDLIEIESGPGGACLIRM